MMRPGSAALLVALLALAGAAAAADGAGDDYARLSASRAILSGGAAGSAALDAVHLNNGTDPSVRLDGTAAWMNVTVDREAKDGSVLGVGGVAGEPATTGPVPYRDVRMSSGGPDGVRNQYELFLSGLDGQPMPSAVEASCVSAEPGAGATGPRDRVSPAGSLPKVSAADRVALRPCPGATVTLSGDIGIVLWNWNATLAHAEGRRELASGAWQEPYADGVPVGRSVQQVVRIEARGALLTLTWGDLDGRSLAVASGADIEAGFLRAEDVRGEVLQGGSWEPLQSSVLTSEGRTGARLAVASGGNDLRLDLHGEPGELARDGQPLGVVARPRGAQPWGMGLLVGGVAIVPGAAALMVAYRRWQVRAALTAEQELVSGRPAQAAKRAHALGRTPAFRREAIILEAQAFADGGRPADALAAAARLQPGDPWRHFLSAYAHARSGRRDACVKELGAALRREPAFRLEVLANPAFAAFRDDTALRPLLETSGGGAYS